MWKALIIDDEKLIRDGLVSYIDWEALGISICATCKNGLEGMAAILTHRPHIVLTDISMPDMDGITLLKQVRLHQIPCDFVFISSYSNFNYAKDAVTYGAFDYLLKPIEAPALESCMGRLTGKLAAEKSKPLPLVNRDDIEKLFLSLLTSMPQSEPVFREMLQYFGINASIPLWMLVCSRVQADETTAFLSAQKQLIVQWFEADISPSMTVYLLCLQAETSMMLDPPEGALGHHHEERTVCTLQNPVFADELRAHLGEPFAPAYLYSCKEGIHAAFLRAQKDMLSTRYPIPGHTDQKNYVNDAGLTTTVIRQSDSQPLSIAMAFLWQRLLGETPQDVPLESGFALFFEKTYGQLEEYYGKPLAGCDTKYQYLKRLREANCLYERFVALHTLLAELLWRCSTQSASDPYTRQAVKMIRSRYGENLSLKQVACEIGISPSHLSAVFKSSTGKTFSDYLFLHRMHTAQELLRHEKYKIYEVGALVGYPDVVQFSKRFKKYFHASPKQWQSNFRRTED